MRNTIYLTFQGKDILLSTDTAHMVLREEQAKELYSKLSDAYGPLPAAPDTTLAPSDCPRCVIKED